MKAFYLKILTIIILCIGIFLSIKNYNTYIQNKNYQIINERQSIIIQLPNAEYIELSARNDHIDDGANYYAHPFSSSTKIQKNSNLESTIERTNINIEYIENGATSSRLTKIIPVDKNNLKIEVYANTQHIYTDNLKYSLQLDYSNKVSIDKEDKDISFSDKGCSIKILSPEYPWTQSSNQQSIIFSQKYDLESIFKINLEIKCNK